MRGDSNPWRHGSKTKDPKLSLIRSAQTRATTKHTISGAVRKFGQGPKPVTLAKIWEPKEQP